MAGRWAGPVLTHTAEHCLAGKYSSHLKLLHSQCEADPHFTVDVLGYTHDMAQGTVSSPFFAGSPQHEIAKGAPDMGNGPQTTTRYNGDMTSESFAESLALADPNQNDGDVIPGQEPILTPSADVRPDQLSTISHMLLNEDFMTMDRIISLDDMIFTAPTCNESGFAWAPDGSGRL